MKAQTSAAAAKNPQRFRDRKTPKRTRPLGLPYANMTEAEKAVWAELAGDMPWLHSAHRVIVRLACHLTARLDVGGEVDTKVLTALSSVMSKLGATPTDETKVNHADDSDEDPADSFFTRPN